MLTIRQLFTLSWLFGLAAATAAPLTTLEYKVSGQQLEVTPSALAVPKGIPGSISVNLRGGLETGIATEGAVVQAILRGPSFAARTLVGAPGEPLLLPPLNLVGDYSLDDIKLVDVDGETLLQGSPSTVPVQVFDEVLVARVTSRPLTSDEIRDRGIVIDENNFRAVEFEVGFVVDGVTVPVRFPVVTPAFYDQTEIIPQAELDEALADAQRINDELALGAELPEELEALGLEIEISPINVQFVDPSAEEDLALSIPPIAGLVVIPGNIGFLNQFFSVQVFVENAAPANSGLSVTGVTSELVLPLGEDRVPGVSFENPGDDPVRFARVEGVGIQNILPVTQAGADGRFGTGDDVDRLRPDEVGQSEFLVEGLREGLHVMDVILRGDLEGLAAGAVEVQGRAAGSVLVRNPNFSLAFSHPRTIRSGEPYEASVTILNTSSVAANATSVTLPTTSISGAVLESDATVLLGDILPGETRTAVYQLRAQRTGAITFSNLSSDDDVTGRFRLRTGVDERGVTLSPDSIGYPEFVDDIPLDLFGAADRVLGQALSVATAAQLPPGVTRVPKRFVTKKVIELAEAGQRLRYGDALERVLIDLALDWQGARSTNAGFEEIIFNTDAGREWRETVARLLAEELPGQTWCERLAERAPDLAGRGEAWLLGGSDSANVATDGADYGGLVLGRSSVLQWHADATGDSSAELCALVVADDGTARLVSWQGVNLPAGAVARFDPASGDAFLQIDANADGTFEATVAGSQTQVAELPPSVIAVIQDTDVNSGRPRTRRCTPGLYENYGTIVAVLYSKPMDTETVQTAQAYMLDDGNGAGSVSIQPGGRVALLNLRRGVGVFRERTMTISGVSDPRGNVFDGGALSVQTEASSGIAVDGRVVRADGSPAADVPVTLTYYEESGLFCDLSKIRPSQMRTDSDGRFSFDFILAGPPYTLSTTDTGGLSDAAIEIILQSSDDDRAVRDRLLDLASQPSVQDTLLETFALGALPEAIAAAEGLDRTLLRDVVNVASDREGSTVPVILRFRGRGTVAGTVYAADGVTPVRGAAVNVFPDPASREQGRGLLTGPDGGFVFYGVPLGVTSIQAVAPDGTQRDLSEALTQNGEVLTVDVVLGSAIVERGTLTGRVFNADGVTPHPFSRVFIGRYVDGKFGNVVAVATSNFEGFWTAEDVPEGLRDIVAVSADSVLRGERRDILAVGDGETVANLTLQGRATVNGRVEFADGRPAANAIVAGGLELVRTNANGEFTLGGVPTGRRTISVGLERDPDNGILFPRLGSEKVDVLAGAQSFVVVRFEPKGSITGRVLDVAGNPVPGINVSLPTTPLSFQYVRTDDNGVYFFENIDLDEWLVSAPAPPASNNNEIIENSLDTISAAATGGDVDQAALLSAITDAFAVFTGVNDPLINGEGETFNPISWGYEEVSLTFDGQVVIADIVYLPEGTVSGTVVNGQDVPIGARVRLTGIGPTRTGDLGFIIRGERNSDPALGTFDFPGQALSGPFGLQAASPFFPVVITHEDATTRLDPDKSDVILQFPETEEVNGRLTGRVFLPDGSPAADVGVKISFGDNFIIRTDADGFFDTQIDLPALRTGGRPGVGYSVEAAEDFDANFDPVGLQGSAYVTVMPGVTNEVSVTLLSRGNLDVLVSNNDGSPAPFASVRVRQVTFPYDEFDATSDISGHVFLSDIFTGHYSVRASDIVGPTTVRGSSAVCVLQNQTAAVEVRLQATGTIQGTFVKEDGVTPVGFAQILIGGGVGFATTDADGRFEVVGMPLGNHRLIGTDPVSGIIGSASVQLSTDGQVRDILLVVRSLGEISGLVINSTGDGFVPGATVTYRPADGLTPVRTATSGPDGAFVFSGAIEGAFTLTAVHPVTRVSGTSSGVLALGQELFQSDISLEPRGEFTVNVLRPDGTTSVGAGEATVTTSLRLFEASVDTDASGDAHFANLELGTYRVIAQSSIPGRERSAAEVEYSVNAAGLNPGQTLVLSGVGSVGGSVFLSDGTTPAVGATVTLRDGSPILGAETRTFVTDSSGAYLFENVSVSGTYRVSATLVALADSVNGTLTADGDADTVNLTLGDSGTVRGRLVRADGSPLSGVAVGVFFDSQSGALGVATDISEVPTADFVMTGIPVGDFNLEAIAPGVNGIVRLSGELVANGEDLDLGDVFLDEADPRVVAVAPTDNSVDVPVASEVLLTFSEQIDPLSFDANGIYLCSDFGSVTVTATVEGDGSIIRLSPDAPLESETVYHVVALDGDRTAAAGGSAALGPKDLVGRPLVIPFQSSFVTADERAPQLLSFTPANGAINVDPRTVVRLSFDEPMRSDGIDITLNGPGGTVPGTVGVGVNGRVVSFVPTFELMPNASYTISASGFADLAGNAANDQPFTSSFGSLDTLGPIIAQLRIKNGLGPVANAAVELEVVLATPDPAARVRISADFVTLGETTTPGDLDLPFTLPASGSVTLRAIAIDAFGNEGPFSQLVLTVQENMPPDIQLVRLNPSNGPLPSGNPFSIQVIATDDSGLAELRAAAAGATTSALQTTDGSPISIVGVIPSSAGSGEALRVFASATDNSGMSTGEVILEIPVSDGTNPIITSILPESGSAFAPGESFEVEVSTEDAFGVTEVSLEISGAFSQSVNVPAIEGVATATFTVPAGLPADGAAFAVTAQASDAAGNVSTATSVALQIPDLIAPTLIGSDPSNGSTAVTPFGGFQPGDFFGTRVTGFFDEALDPATFVVGSATMRDSSGTDVPGTVLPVNASPQWAEFRPTAPLRFEETYTVTFTPEITDLAGNPIPVSTVTFSTSTLAVTVPEDESQVVEGQALTFQASGDSGRAIVRLEFTGPTGILGSANGSISFNIRDYEAAVTIPLLSELGDPPYVFGADARYHRNGGGVFAPVPLNPITLDVRPAGEDTDGDGLINSIELANGLEPFRDDADEDADSDTLTNAEEIALGTDPQRSDTDGDGIRDDIDPNPLVPLGGAAPIAGVPGLPSGYLRFNGIDDDVEAPIRAANGLAAAVTVEGWLRTTQTVAAGSAATVITKWRGGTDERYAYGVWVAPGGVLRYQAGSSGQPSIVLEGTTAINDGEWHHFACVRDGTAAMRLYIDGLEDAVDEDFTLILDHDLANASRTFFGTTNGNLRYEGDMDEIRLWNTVRSQDEIRQHASRTLGGLESGLVAYWPFDEGGGDTGYDQSIRDTDAKIDGGTTRMGDGLTFYKTPIFTANQDTDSTLTLPAFDADGAEVSAAIVALPANGSLFQTADGSTKGTEILAVDLPAVVSDTGRRVIYEPAAAFAGPDPLRYSVTDPGEGSAVADSVINVRLANTPPSAMPDTVVVFQDVENVIDPTSNDTDPDGETPRIVYTSPAANGVVTQNEDGTISYTPDPGFTGNDSFDYIVADSEAWNRLGDFVEGSTEGSYLGNPAVGPLGFPVWQHDIQAYAGSLDSANPWYQNTGTKAVWNSSWRNGGSAVWAGPLGGYPLLYRTSIEASTRQTASGMPAVRWICPFDDYSIDVLGNIGVYWRGHNVGAGTEVDVAMALLDASDGSITDLFVQTITKPTEDTSNEEIFPSLDLRDISIDQGDTLILTLRNQNNTGGSMFLGTEDMWILPANATNTSTVSVTVRSNAVPVASGRVPASGLDFDGGRDRVDLGNPPELQITGDQTIEMWLRPTDFSSRRNPWAKAYAGEGTITQETNGWLTFFWGNLGSNSGSNPANYQAFNSQRALPLNEWTHIAIVRDLTNGILRWYFDGELTNEAAPFYPAAVAGANSALIGDGYTTGFAGQIDEVRVWNTARTQAEIQANRNARLAGTELGLAGYWPFEEGAGTSTADGTAAGNAGTLGTGGTIPSWIDSFAPFENPLLVIEDVAQSITLDGTDADGDALTAVVTLLPEFGTLFQTVDGTTLGAEITAVPTQVTDPSRRVIFVPSPDDVGFDSISYLVNDGMVDSPEATLLLNVTPINDAPRATEDAYNTVADVPITTGNVFANDFDPEGDNLLIESFTQPASGGSVTDNGNGTFEYIPGVGFDGNDFFEYTITDGVSVGNTVRVDVLVTALNEFAWNNPAGGNWGDASNWTPNGVPGSGDRAVIDLEGDYTVTVNVDVSISSIVAGAASGTQTVRLTSRTLTVESQAIFGVNTIYSQSGGDLRGGGAVFFDGAANSWTRGNMRDSGRKTVRGTMNVSPTSSVALIDNGALVNEGTLIFDGSGIFYAYNGATIRNAPGALFDIRTDADMNHIVGTRARFTNEGTLRKSVGASDTLVGWIVDNAGGSAIEVQTGRLEFRGGGSNTDAPYTVEAGATLGFGGLNHTMDAACTLTGTGGLLVRGGTVDWDGTMAPMGNVALTSGTLRVDGSATFAGNYSQSGGDLRGGGTVFFDGTANSWTGGNMRDAGQKTMRGTMNVSPTSSVTLLDNGALVNEGTLIFDGSGLFYAYNGATIRNAPGALFDIRTDADMNHIVGTRARLTNEGTLRKSAGTADTLVGWVVDNAVGSAVEVQAGRLEFGGGGTNSSTSYTVAAGATLGFNGLTHTVDADCTLTGAGGLLMRGGAVDWDGTMTLGETVTLSGGTLRIDGTATFTGNYTQSRGDLRGNGTVFFDGAANSWTGGNMRDAGLKTLRGTMNVSPPSSASLIDNGALVNEGTLIFDGAGLFYAYSGATIRNASGALFDIRADGDMNHFNGTRARLTNEGTLRKSAGTAETLVGWTINNSAGSAVEVQTGRLNFRGGGTNTDATYTVAAGATLGFSGLNHTMDADSTLAGDGGLLVTSGTVDWDGILTPGGDVTVTNGTLRIDGSATFAGNYTQSRGDLRGSGTVFFDGTANSWTGGNMRDAGLKTLRGTMNVTPSSSASLLDNGALVNEGTLIFDGAGLFYAYGGATIRNAPGALFDVRTNADMGHFNGVRAAFNNEGEFRKSAGGAESFIQWNINNSGLINCRTGTLSFRDGFAQTDPAALIFLNGGNLNSTPTMTLAAGSLSGTGTFTGSLVNTGATILPGSPTGTMTISGNYTQGAGGTLGIDINDRPATSDFDKLSIGGSATLDGTFALAVAPGFVAELDDSFRVIDYASRTGQFATLTGLTPGAGVDYMEVYNADNFTLNAIEVQALIEEESPVFAGTFDDWAERIGEPLPPNGNESPANRWDSDPDADPDGDGSSNLQEYAFSTDPLVADLHGFPHVEIIEEAGQRFLQFTYCERSDKSDLRIFCETSQDLLDWTTEGLVEIRRGPGLSGTNSEMVTVRRSTPLQLSSRGYMRIMIVLE